MDDSTGGGGTLVAILGLSGEVSIPETESAINGIMTRRKKGGGRERGRERELSAVSSLIFSSVFQLGVNNFRVALDIIRIKIRRENYRARD